MKDRKAKDDDDTLSGDILAMEHTSSDVPDLTSLPSISCGFTDGHDPEHICDSIPDEAMTRTAVSPRAIDSTTR